MLQKSLSFNHHHNMSAIIDAIPAVLIVINCENEITEWNQGAEAAFGLKRTDVVGKKIHQCPIPWEWPDGLQPVLEIFTSGQHLHIDNLKYTHNGQQARIMDLLAIPIFAGREQACEYLLIGQDFGFQTEFENRLQHFQRLEDIGRLACGIAHEINTPIQFIGDNLHFMQDAFADLIQLLASYQTLLDEYRRQRTPAPEAAAQVEELIKKAGLGYLQSELPKAAAESLQGIERVSAIVRAMKNIAYHDTLQEQLPTDINDTIQNTITVSRNEWKYVAEVKTDLDPSLPRVTCLPGEINQVMLNLIVNAAHAIQDALGDHPASKGLITLTTRQAEEFVEIRIQDTGSGIPEAIRSKIFTPFFTTKPAGRGTGQGLPISRAVVVNKLHGTLTFETETGRGTTFIVRLPILSSKEPKP